MYEEQEGINFALSFRASDGLASWVERLIRVKQQHRQQTATDGYKRHMAMLPFFGFTAKNGNVADATHPASAPIADARKTAPAPGAGAGVVS